MSTETSLKDSDALAIGLHLKAFVLSLEAASMCEIVCIPAFSFVPLPVKG